MRRRGIETRKRWWLAWLAWLPGIVAPDATLRAEERPDVDEPTVESPVASPVDLLDEFDALTAAGKWTEAVPPAEALARQAEATAGAKSLAYAEALTRLAEVQRRAGDHASAELDFARAIGIIEGRSGGLSGRLIEPLRGLGFTYAEMHDHARAAPVLERAVLTTRRNRGLFDPSQLDVLAQLAMSQTQIGEFEAAEQSLRYRVQVAEQAYGTEDPRVAEPISALARWYSRAAAYDVARSFYRSAIERVEKGGSRDDLALVEPLRGLAENSMRAFVFGDYQRRDDVGTSMSSPSTTLFDQAREDPRPGNRRRLNREGDEALERALAILHAQPPGSQGITLTSTLLQAGDWHLAKGEPEPAHARYREAWTLSRTNPQVLAATKGSEPDQTVLGFPVAIYVPGGAAAPAEMLQQSETDEHFVLAEFTVGVNGEVSAIEVVETDASERQARDTVDSLEVSIFRPRYLDGEPVATTGVRYRDVYRDRRSDGA